MKLIDLFEAINGNIDPYQYWSEDQIDHMARYARNMTFKTEEEAKEWIERKLNNWDAQWLPERARGAENNRIIASLTPLYQSGKSFKIGKRIRITKKPWEGVEIIRPSLQGLLEVGWINDFDGYKVLGIKMLPTRLLRITENHSETQSGQEKVYSYANRIKEDETFLAIIVDTDYTILDGHHRYRAVMDVLKWKKIPCLVIKIGDDT